MPYIRAFSVAVALLAALGCSGVATSSPTQAVQAPAPVASADVPAAPKPAPRARAKKPAPPVDHPQATTLIPPPTSPAYLKVPTSTFETVSFDVLDIDFDAERVAFRHVFRPLAIFEGEPPVVDCGYEGVESEASVTLGVWDLRAGKVAQSWDIYPPAASKSECLGHETSSARLAEAKATFQKLGLNIAAYPRSAAASLTGFQVQGEEMGEDLVRHSEVWYGTQHLFTVALQGTPCGGPRLALDRVWVEDHRVLLLQNLDTQLGCMGGVWQPRVLGPVVTLP